eukprot:399202-Prymnesium_polylepis.1
MPGHLAVQPLLTASITELGDFVFAWVQHTSGAAYFGTAYIHPKHTSLEYGDMTTASYEAAGRLCSAPAGV